MSRKAIVSLVTYDLEDYGKFINLVTKVLVLTDIISKHWALIVDFEDDNSTYLCEMCRDSGALLNGKGDISWTCEPTSVEKLLIGKSGVNVYNLGSVQTSLNVLKKLCKQNTCNGKIYNLYQMNCQSWAMELLYYLGKSTPGIKKALYAAASLITAF